MKTSQLLRACANLAAACAALAAFGGPASAESFQKVRASVDQRLRSALQELDSTREKIAKEKIPLSKSVSALEDQVLMLRRKRDELVKVRDSRTIDLSSLRKQVDSYGDQEEFINGRLNEFVRDFESHLAISELPRYEKLTAAAKLADRNVNLDAVGKREAQVAVVDAALQRLRAILGGEIYAGEALSPEGVLTAGKFVALGPTTFFASDDGRTSGLVENQLNAADPVVVPLPGGLDSGVASVAQSGKGELPLDPTLGKALKTTKARETLVEHLRKGGAIGTVILLLGAVALGLTLFKGREILGFPVAAADEVDGVLGELAKGNREAAAWQAKQIEGVAGDMLTTGVEHADERRELLEELLFEKILSVRPTLERFLPFLAITAAAAPLLGLLGTVTGMIKTFELLTIFGTGDARSLSSGISQALVTTELGLMVAIPTLILHGALVRMAKHKLGLLEQLSMALVNGLSTIRFRSQSELSAARILRDVRES